MTICHWSKSSCVEMRNGEKNENSVEQTAVLENQQEDTKVMSWERNVTKIFKLMFL